MTNRDKLGAAVMITLFTIFIAVLYWTIQRPSDRKGGFEDNVILEQRQRIENSR